MNPPIDIQNLPAAFNFSVNNAPQNTMLVPLSEMYYESSARVGKHFIMRIADWKQPDEFVAPATPVDNTSVDGDIVMLPGQTLICTPFTNSAGTPLNDFRNNKTGAVRDPITGEYIRVLKAKPGCRGPLAGFEMDWPNPEHSPYGIPVSQQNDQTDGVLGVKDNDLIQIEFGIQRPGSGVNSRFEVTSKLRTGAGTFNYGKMTFDYTDNSVLNKFFYARYKNTSFKANSSRVPITASTAQDYASAKAIGVFTASARTTSGGVYESGKRSKDQNPASANALRDGRLAGMPFLFHNAARSISHIDVAKQKLGGHSHEINFQPLPGTGEYEKYLEIDAQNRTGTATGNQTTTGIKSASYLELPTGPMQTIADFRRSNALASVYMPYFTQPVSNSRVSPQMLTSAVIHTDSKVATYPLLDHSSLANHALYDTFYFSTFASNGTLSQNPASSFTNFMSGSSPLPTQSFTPYLPKTKSISTAHANLFNGNNPTETAYLDASQYQMVRGPFNVNSTSKEAWKAVLSSLKNSDIATLIQITNNNGKLVTNLDNAKSDSAMFPGMSLLNGNSVSADTEDNEVRSNNWNGYRRITDSQIDNLATEIVAQVRNRGPFLSMSEFVNRQIGTLSNNTLMGALEAAITSSGLNPLGSDPSSSYLRQTGITLPDLSDTNLYDYNTPSASIGNPAAGAPGWISQGDIMKIIEPTATVRSDTFVVRTYGEARDSRGKILATAYAEALIQRYPDYIEASNNPSLAPSATTPVNQTFGRRLSIVSFRWLSKNEI